MGPENMTQPLILGWILYFISAIILPSYGLQFPIERGPTCAFFVATNGTDSPNCGTHNTPCRSIQMALNQITANCTQVSSILLLDGEFTGDKNCDVVLNSLSPTVWIKSYRF